MIIPYVYGKIKNVPNHQPGISMFQKMDLRKKGRKMVSVSDTAIENVPVEIVSFLIQNGGYVHSSVSLPEGT